MCVCVGEELLGLRADIYTVLLHIHSDRGDWSRALQLLDQAVRDLPRSRHRLWVEKHSVMTEWQTQAERSLCLSGPWPCCSSRVLLKHRVLLKARLAQDVLMDMQRLQDEGEQCCSLMWHQVALCAGSISQQLTAYQQSIASLRVRLSLWGCFHIITWSCTTDQHVGPGSETWSAACWTIIITDAQTAKVPDWRWCCVVSV